MNYSAVVSGRIRLIYIAEGLCSISAARKLARFKGSLLRNDARRNDGVVLVTDDCVAVLWL